MKITILYLLLVISIGIISGFMIVFVNLESHKKNKFPYILILSGIYFSYMAIMLGLAQSIWWITNNFHISEIIKGLGTLLMIIFVLPSTRVAKKIFR